MKLKRSIKTRDAIGTLVTDDHTQTARVQQEGDTLRLLASTTTAPDALGSTTRYGVALGGLVGVLHRLDLPPADDATTGKLIAAQLDTLIPGQADHVRWGWKRTGEDHLTPVVTVSRRRFDALVANLPSEATAPLVTTAALAIHHLFAHASADPDRTSLLVIAWDSEHVHVIHHRDGQLHDLDTLICDNNGSAIKPETLAAMIQDHLGDRAGSATDPVDAAFTLIGPEPPDTACVSSMEQVLGGVYRRAEGLIDLPGLERLTFDTAVSAGAAIAALHPDQAISFTAEDASQTDRATGRPSRRRWALAAAAMLAALTLLCVGDLKRADRMASAVEEANLETQQLTQLNTDLQVASYLEKAGPSFLAILDEFSHQTEGFVIDEMRYERSGQFTVRATGRSSDQINQLAAKLSEMRTLTSVRIRNQVVKDRDKIEYTLVAEPSSRYTAPFAPPPRQPDTARDNDSQQAESGTPQTGGGA